MDSVKKKISTLKKKLAESIKNAEYEEEEFANNNAEAQATEEEVKELQEIVITLEDELDAIESQMSTSTSKIIEVEKIGDESLQQKKILENRNTMDADKVDRLTHELQTHTEHGTEVTERLETVQAQLVELEEKLDIEEERFEVADGRVKELEVEVTNVGNTLRSTETNDMQTNLRIESADVQLTDLEDKKTESEEAAVELEEQAKQLELELDEHEVTLAAKKEEYAQSKSQMESCLNEINDM